MEFKFKIWIEENGNFVLGKGGYQILKEIQKTGYITEAAKNLGMSYKFAWEYVKRVNRIEQLKTKKGVKGGTEIPEKINKILQLYEMAEKEVNDVLKKYDKMLSEIIEGP
ncbi:hypothetical protein HS7_04690 [Sulfolobales archaeon HS-7]|nr:hypothetical protein HS7_04690 [Sulfolobales archaeon HS-7]